jgi:hypothetical protein
VITSSGIAALPAISAIVRGGMELPSQDLSVHNA